jgi:hypothetical protein
VKRLSGLGQPRRPGPPGQPPVTGRHAIATGTGLFLITVGAILLFAVRVGSTRWLNLHIAGLILILWGVLGLLLPWLAGDRGDRLRRWVVPLMPRATNAPPPGEDPAVDDDDELVRESGVNGDRPTLADDLLRLEHDPPL